MNLITKEQRKVHERRYHHFSLFHSWVSKLLGFDYVRDLLTTGSLMSFRDSTSRFSLPISFFELQSKGLPEEDSLAINAMAESNPGADNKVS